MAENIGINVKVIHRDTFAASKRLYLKLTNNIYTCKCSDVACPEDR